jgi:excisionase family DNA binding protein
MPEPRYLKTAEVARRLHVSSKTVARYARLRMLPHVTTPGGHRRYPEPAVIELERRMSEGLGTSDELVEFLSGPNEEAS